MDKSYEVRREVIKANPEQWKEIKRILVRDIFMAEPSLVYMVIGKIEHLDKKLTQDEIDFFNEMEKIHIKENS